MDSKGSGRQTQGPLAEELPVVERSSHGRIVSLPSEPRYLDAVQLAQLEQSFRGWAEGSSKSDVRLSRKRILLIFLLIRYTGAKLSEVLALDPFREIDCGRQVVVFGKEGSGTDRPPREVQIPGTLSLEIQAMLADTTFDGSLGTSLRVDPGHVRRKFYERAAACGFPQELGAPDAIRKSRAVELLQNNLPLPVVQRILGHSTPNLTASFVEFSDNDVREVARLYVEKETRRKTSARNTFFGKIGTVQRGDVQSKVEVITLGGGLVTAVITTDSLSRLGLKAGSLVTAEVKAPWVVLERADGKPDCTAENGFSGTVARVNEGDVITEYVVRIEDGSELCSLVTSENSRKLGLQEDDPVWVLFSSFSVVLHTD
ncbi:MAG: TOBE domain-containing protein [Chloroflexota bacterium]